MIHWVPWKSSGLGALYCSLRLKSLRICCQNHNQQPLTGNVSIDSRYRLLAGKTEAAEAVRSHKELILIGWPTSAQLGLSLVVDFSLLSSLIIL